jgi:hypothetical protein
MAGSIVQIVGPGGAATAATTVVSSSITVTAGNTLWVIAISDDATISSCTDSISGSNTYTERGSVIEAAITRRLHHLTAPITVGGTGTVTVTFGASVANRQIWLVELTGVAGGYLNQGTATDTGNNPTTAASATNASQPMFAIAALVDYQGGTPTARNINGAAATSGGTLASGGQLGGILEYTAGITTTGTNTADFNNASFSRTCTVFLLMSEAGLAPTINTQPSDQTAFDGASATFTVNATASGGSLSYQWQDNSSGSFANIGGATSASLTVLASLSMNGRLYRVNVTDSNGTTTSSNATLFVRTITAFWPPRPITQPPFKRAKSTLWLLDPSNWGGASLNVGKWFADEMPTGAASPNVTKALTGVNATGSVGTVVSNVSYAITGNQASGSVGTVKSAVNYALTGNAATGQVGTVVSNITYGLTGVQATGAVGTVSYATDVTLALTGVSATGQVGTVIPNVSYALTGNQATGQVGTVTSAVSYALTGVAATGQVGTLTSNVSYALTGNQATGQVGTVSAGNDVTFALTGVQATGNVGAVTPNITYALTGVQASGQVGTVTASPSYGLTGNQATGQVGTVASAISYGLTGVEGAGQVGTVSVPGDVTIALTGVQATGFVGDLLLQIASNVPAGGSGGYEHEAAIIRYRRAVARRQQEAEIAAKAKAEADEAQQRLNTANTKRQREKEARIIEKLRLQEEAARTLEEQLLAEIELLQRAILGANAQQTAMQAEEEEFALMFALTTLI